MVKKIKRILLLFCAITAVAVPVCAGVFSGRVVDIDGTAVEGALAIGLKKDTTYVNSATTDSTGLFELPVVAEIRFVRIQSLGMKPVMLNAERGDFGEIILQAGESSLDEISVMADLLSQEGDKLIFRLTKEQLDKYPQVALALNEIPNMVVYRDRSAMFQGSSNLLFMLDGQKSTLTEIAAISKDDLARIEISQVPPARYANEQVTAVINVITKLGLYGGNVSVDK